MRELRGVVRGKTIELEDGPGLPDGQDEMNQSFNALGSDNRFRADAPAWARGAAERFGRGLVAAMLRDLVLG